MADVIPSVTVVVGAGGNAIATTDLQTPLDVSQPIVILPPTVNEVVVKPVTGNTEPLDHLSTLRAGVGALDRFRAVVQRPDGFVEPLNASDRNARRAFLGIVLNPAGAGRKTTICIHGVISNANWSWQPGPVHCDDAGLLTQDITQDTFHVAQALTPTMLLIGAPGTSDGVPAETQTFVWVAPSASTTWSIIHNLGRYPSVTLVDSAHSVMLADITYDNINTVTVEFAYATAGSAYLV